jgi:hypothetical protein
MFHYVRPTTLRPLSDPGERFAGNPQTSNEETILIFVSRTVPQRGQT